MKKVLIVCALIVITCYCALSQNVGINATGAAPDASAILDVSSSTQGLLAPRVALTATTASAPIVGTPLTSLLVYNTATAGTAPNNVIPGFYYWNGTSWIPFSTASNTAWTLTGNSGLTTANFLGTTDDVALAFRSNNQSFLEFGRRATLGLTQGGFVDYDDNNEKVTYVRSALQFEAAGAAFYKPKMWTDVNGNFRVKGASAGTDYFEFGATGTANNGGFNFIIGDDGDEPMVFSTFDFNGPLNNGVPTVAEVMRIQSGRMAVGSNAFDATNPEKLLIDGGVTTSYNLMTGKGSIDNYLQINIKNSSAGTSASSDIVATNNTGTETNNFVDMGINSSGYVNAAFTVTAANDAYLYTVGNDFAIGNGTAARSLKFFTGGTLAANERLRIDGTGNVGIGLTAPTRKLDVNGAIGTGLASTTNGSLVFSNSTNANTISLNTGVTTLSHILTLPTTQGAANTVLSNDGAGALSWQTISAAASAWGYDGNAIVTTAKSIGTTTNFDLPFITNNTEKMRILAGGNVGIGAVVPAEKLEVNGNIKINGGNRRLIFGNALAGADPDGVIELRATGATEQQEMLFYMGNDNTNGFGPDRLRMVAEEISFQNFNVDANSSLANAETQTTLNTRMFISNPGNVAIGTTTFNVANPEKFVVDAGTTTSVNAIVGKGSINNYLQLNIQNTNAGTNASSDVVATADNGSETTNYIDMGINSSVNTSGVMGVANDAYLYNLGQNLLIGTGTAAKSLVFMTGGTTQATNERMRIDGTGNVGIGDNAPNSTLEVNGTLAMKVVTVTGNFNLTTATNYVVINTGGGTPTWTFPAAAAGNQGRIYRLVNHGSAAVTLSAAVTTANGVTTTNLPAGSNFEIISDGTFWRKIN